MNVARAYDHWGRTGEWINSNDLARVLARRAAAGELRTDETVTTL